MKKSTTKSAKSPAPATSKTTTKKAPAAKTTATAVVTAVPTAVATPMPKVAISVPTVKAGPGASVQTKIVARVDVGFGNTLYIRGDGAGLSWEKGLAMECVGGDAWEITLGESARPVSFKVLINDSTWNTGPDSVAASGSTVTIAPEFA